MAIGTDDRQETIEVSRELLGWLADSVALVSQHDGRRSEEVVRCDGCGVYGFDNEMERGDDYRYCSPQCQQEIIASQEG